MAMNKDFGGFELKEKIGSGGMASVYLAVQKSLQRPVVLKILYPHLAEDEKLVQRFEREARAAAMMRHENIIQVIDCGRYEDVAYIAMEFVEGMDLKKWLEAHGTPPIEMALLMLRDLCKGLEHAHGHRIIHRDIKPANVMLTPDGTIKLMDFGLARSGAETSTQMTMVGSVMGTPAYMSPEQATGEVVDERSDIFSSGIVAYELLGGQRPFSGDSYSTVLRSILTVEPPEVTHFNPLVPEEVARIVRGMLQKDVSKRYASIAQVREDLEGVIEQMGLLRGKDLLKEYALDPQTVGDRWRSKRLSRHLDQGLYFENMGLGKIDDALLEFRRVLHLDPENATAREHVKKLERERDKLIASQAPAEPAQAPAPPNPEGEAGNDRTMIMTPGQATSQPGQATSQPPSPGQASVPPSPAGEASHDATMLFSPGQAAAASSLPPSAPPPPAAGASIPPAPKPAEKKVAAAPAPKPAPPAKPSAPAAKSGGLPMPMLAGIGVLVVLIIAVVVMLMNKKGDDASKSQPVATNVPPVTAPVTPPVSEPTKTTPAPSEPTKTPPVVTSKPTTKPSVLTSPVPMKPAPEKPAPEKKTPEKKAPTKTQTPPAPVPAPAPKEDPKSNAMATLIVKATPFAATLTVDGDNKGANQSQFKLSLKPGKHTVRMTHTTGAPYETTVNLEPGDEQTVTHDFTGNFGSISVSADPTWGEIYLDGDPQGKTTPFVISNLRPKEYQVVLVRDGYTVEGGAQFVTVKPGQTVNVKFKLKQKK
jgi:tRNA A-37 threonylcarbamoyl transferase component Bud32